jgi:hypothetical protein
MSFFLFLSAEERETADVSDNIDLAMLLLRL